MKLLFVLPAYEPAWAFGGVVRAIASLCRGLAYTGHDVAVVTISSDGDGQTLNVPLAEPIDRGGVKTFYFASTFGPRSVFDSRDLVRFLDRNVSDFDLVYVSAVWQWIGIEALRICSHCSAPLVFGPHGSLDSHLLKRGRLKKELFWRLFVERSLKAIAAVHYTTSFEREQSSMLKGCQSFIVPNGLDWDQTIHASVDRSVVRRRWHLPDSAAVAIFVGRADPKKRGDLVLRAIAEAPGVFLLMVGPLENGAAREWRALAASLGVSNRVVWTGLLQGVDLSEAYSAADVLVFPSEDENFGMVVIEAMAHGIPVLTTREVGVWGDVAQYDVGSEIARDPADIAGKLRQLVATREAWRARGRLAKQVAQDLFDSISVARLMSLAFEDVLSGKRSPECRWSL